ncbi:MAG: carbohydrate ABC transporter substrate-binding protein [Rhodospirillales bacterium]|nr:carbohydrate ABC transporter substrate-binding protein [Rhodospirillales bacterium]
MKDLRWLLALGLTAGFVAPAAAQKATVINYYTSGGESRAISVFAKEYNKRGGQWVNEPAVGPPAEQSLALSRIAGGDPPTAMQWSVGAAMKELADKGVLADLDSFAKAGDWAKNVPPIIMKNITFNGHVYGAPFDIGGVNYMYYSTKVFDALKMKPPKTWDEFLADAPKIKAAGYIPLAFGGNAQQEDWLFMSLLAGVGGPQVYSQVTNDHDAKVAGSAAVQRVFQVYGALRQYVDAGSPNRKWNDSLSLVETNKAAFMIVGDWASGDFAANHLTFGKDFGCSLAPGSQDAYIMVTDAMAFPASNKPEQVAARAKLVGVVMDPAVQAEFNVYKGSLPAMLNTDVSKLDPCAQLGYKVMLKGPTHQLPHFFLAFSPNTLGEINDVLAEYWVNSKMTAADATKKFAAIVARAGK